MGFLQQDTNNIILDTVLTDTGRQFLARNDGSFSVIKFAPGDDEIDYTLIQKFGRSVGQEKIEKNTPVFEALTNQSYAQKNRLISVSNPNLIRLPNLTITGTGVDSTNNIVSIGTTTVKNAQITVSQAIVNETSIDVELVDQSYVLEVSNLFLQVLQKVPDNVDGNQRAIYILTRDATTTPLGGSQVTFRIATKAITAAQFQVYGAKYNKNLISTFARISGVQSGAVLEFSVQINQLS
jgi:hypothetical protein